MSIIRADLSALWGRLLCRRWVLLTSRSTFSSSGNSDSKSGSKTGPTIFNSESSHPHKDYEEQLRDLAEERQSLFGFTDEEESAWSRIAANPETTHSSTFLQTVEAARRQKHEAEEIDTTAEPDSSYSGIRNHAQSLTHVSEDGSSVQMVHVGTKEVTSRTAKASTRVQFPSHVWDQLTGGKHDATELMGKKGPILTTAKLAGIMGAKQTSSLIPLCHPLPLEQVQVQIELDPARSQAIVECECRTTHKTGVEMEALMGASVAALTVYDMVKALSHGITITETKLVSKTGGKRDYSAPE